MRSASGPIRFLGQADPREEEEDEKYQVENRKRLPDGGQVGTDCCQPAVFRIRAGRIVRSIAAWPPADEIPRTTAGNAGKSPGCHLRRARQAREALLQKPPSIPA